MTEYIVRGDGRMFRRDLREYEIMVGQELMDRICADHQVKIPRVAQINGQIVGVCVGSGQSCYWTVRLKSLGMNCHWNVVEGVTVPNFAVGEGVEMAIEWKIPDGMTLAFIAQTSRYSNDQVTFAQAWLLAYGDDNTTWHLPLGNLFDDCRLCMGQYTPLLATHSAVLNDALTHFNKSQWNADLWKTKEQTQRMFRFKPKPDDGWEQQPILADDWRKLCAKVGVEIAEQVVL